MGFIYMKVFKYLCFCGLLALSSNAAAKSYETMQGRNLFTLGFDVTDQYAKIGNSWNKITYPNKIGAQFYLAYRATKTFAFELGYNWTDSKPRSLVLNPGETAFGANSILAQTIVGKVRLKDTYIDVYAHKKLAQCIEGKLGIGVGWVRQTIKFFPSPVNINDPVQQALVNINGRTTTTFRINAGLQALLMPRIGVRALIGYQTLNSIDVDGTNPNTSPKMFGNAIWGAVGVYWNFYGYYQ